MVLLMCVEREQSLSWVPLVVCLRMSTSGSSKARGTTQPPHQYSVSSELHVYTCMYELHMIPEDAATGQVHVHTYMCD